LKSDPLADCLRIGQDREIIEALLERLVGPAPWPTRGQLKKKSLYSIQAETERLAIGDLNGDIFAEAAYGLIDSKPTPVK
jgi:hypothetical protein